MISPLEAVQFFGEYLNKIVLNYVQLIRKKKKKTITRNINGTRVPVTHLANGVSLTSVS